MSAAVTEITRSVRRNGRLRKVGFVAEAVGSERRRKTALADLLAAERSARVAAKHAELWADPLRQAAASAMTPLSLDSVLADALRAIADALSADAAAILLASPAGDELIARASVGLAKEVEVKMRIHAGAGVAGRVLASAEPLIVPDLSRVEVASETLRTSGVRSWAGVPLRSEDRVVGVMHVTSRSVAYFSEDDIEVLEALAESDRGGDRPGAALRGRAGRPRDSRACR